MSRKGGNDCAAVFLEQIQDFIIIPCQANGVRAIWVKRLVRKDDYLLAVLLGGFEGISEPFHLNLPNSSIECDITPIEALNSLRRIFVAQGEVRIVLKKQRFCKLPFVTRCFASSSHGNIIRVKNNKTQTSAVLLN